MSVPTSQTASGAPAARQIKIPARFQSWPGIVNGGYLAGLLYRRLGGTVEVTMRRPTPLDAPLHLSARDGSAELTDGDGCLVSAVAVDAELEPPGPVSYEEALLARDRYYGFGDSRLSSCFVCGCRRRSGQGLRIFSGPLAPGRVAAPWIPAPVFRGGGSAVATEYVVAALDCPGGWAIASVSERLYVPMVLGRATIRTLEPVRTGRPHVVVGRATGEDGRKRFCTTAIYEADGRLCAVAEAIWFPMTTPPRS